MVEEKVKSLEEMVKQLSPEQQAKVRDFIEFLLAKQRARPYRKPQFDWAGALKEMRDEYTSVDLQHEITRLRGGVE